MNDNSKRLKMFAGLILVSTSLIMLIAGCATVGQDFPTSRVSDIKIGQTTQNDIRSMFGSPWRVGIEDGQRTWTYGKYGYGLFTEKNAKDLLIRFDDNGIVASYTFSTTEHDE
ncbi:MAG: outer membrane protein assembly factor BamE [Nitrospirota bacterium]